MWKRFQGHGRGKERQIGNPVLLETTYDEDQLRHIPNVSTAQNAAYQPNAPSHMTPQSYDHISPPNPHNYTRASEVPTVSSLYSQPSPAYRYDYNQTTASPSGYQDISPPSSPEPEQEQVPGQPRRFRSMRDVSPVDENRGRFGVRGGSSIPVLRRAPGAVAEGDAKSTQKFWGGKVASGGKVKWDEYSGEPTSSTAGKAGQVSPGSYAKAGVPTSAQRPMGYHVSVTAPEADAKKAATLSERVSRFGTRPAPVDTTKKPSEPWSRATGRAEIAPPLKDQRSDKPLQYPRKPNPKSPDQLPKGVSNSLTGIVERDPVPADTTPVADDPELFDTHESPIKPVVPLKVGRNTPLASPTTPHSKPIQAPYSYPSPVTPTHNHVPVPAVNKQTESTRQLHSAQTNTKVPRKSIEGTPDSKASKDNGPASRFSWTTYNSSTHQQSPPPSPPPLPVSRVQTEPVSAASTILNRRRPVPQPEPLPSRKPVPSSVSTATITMSPDPPSPRPDSTFSTSTHKALPRPPTELTAADHIEILESQMDDLRVRRSNVYRLLNDLNNAAPPNPMVTDFRRMRLVEQRKKDFEDELAEIKREEHDVGLKLHRAWRKREKDDPNGSESALWVRRVTR